MHDDQHGTAVVILAAMINAAAVVGKRFEDMTIVLNGSGAAGTATIKMLLASGVRDVIAVDRDGAIIARPEYDKPHWTWLAQNTNHENRKRGLLRDVLKGADAFIGVSARRTSSAGEDIAADGPRPDRVRDGQPEPGDHARSRGAVRRRDGHRAQRLSRTKSTTCSPSRASSAARSTCARARSAKE